MTQQPADSRVQHLGLCAPMTGCRMPVENDVPDKACALHWRVTFCIVFTLLQYFCSTLTGLLVEWAARARVRYNRMVAKADTPSEVQTMCKVRDRQGVW